MQRSKENQDYMILYVAAEDKSLKYFTKVFCHEYRILGAANTPQGYRLLKLHRDKIALVMTDQRMAGKRGVEFLRRARQITPKTIRILTTAYSDFDVVEGVNSGVISKIVTEPWDISQLEIILRDACELFSTEHQASRTSDGMRTDRRVPLRRREISGLWTLEQLTRYLNVNRFTVYRLVGQKEILAFKVGNQWRFKQEDIDSWLMGRANISKKKL